METRWPKIGIGGVVALVVVVVEVGKVVVGVGRCIWECVRMHVVGWLLSQMDLLVFLVVVVVGVVVVVVVVVEVVVVVVEVEEKVCCICG